MAMNTAMKHIAKKFPLKQVKRKDTKKALAEKLARKADKAKRKADKS